ncbi:MAG: PEP/pyruvate-binding domain-containing protein, partial [Thermoplasmata archaeon]
MPLFVTLEEVSTHDHALVGGKASKLGEVVREGLPVPPGFVVTTECYRAFVDGTALKEIIPAALATLDPSRSESIDAVAQKLRGSFEVTAFPPEIRSGLEKELRSYEKLHGVKYSAVRSSATAEDLESASFAGMQETYLNVTGVEATLSAVKNCWSSLFTPRVLAYRARKGFEHASVELAVLIQKMVDSSVSGILFTRDPNTGENHMIIEAGFGLGELIVGGEITPDHYVVDGMTQRIVQKQVADQPLKLVRAEGGGNRREEVPPAERSLQKLSDERILKLASLARVIESHYRRPMDVEWCAEGNSLYIVQARPITTLPKGAAAPEGDAPATVDRSGPVAVPVAPHEKPLVRGMGVSPGIRGGRARRLLRAAETDRLLPGEVLVTTMTTPDMVPAMT